VRLSILYYFSYLYVFNQHHGAMNPIVVAVDFSNTSIHALEYAIPLANKFKSNIMLVWVDKVTPAEAIYPDTSAQNRAEAKKRFEELIRQYHKRLSKEITIDYKLKKGKIYHEVENLALSLQASLIVTGAHGISGYEEYWIGSNAYKIVTYASIPVITVRHDFPLKKSMDLLVVPIDNSPETLQKLPFVVKLATLFKSTIHLVTTHTSHLKSIQRIAEKYAQIAQEYLSRFDLKYIEDEIVSNDITRDMLTYCNQVEADLIAIMTEQETPSNILMGLYAQQVINQSAIPVLSLHPQDNFSL